MGSYCIIYFKIQIQNVSFACVECRECSTKEEIGGIDFDKVLISNFPPVQMKRRIF